MKTQRVLQQMEKVDETGAGGSPTIEKAGADSTPPSAKEATQAASHALACAKLLRKHTETLREAYMEGGVAPNTKVPLEWARMVLGPHVTEEQAWLALTKMESEVGVSSKVQQRANERMRAQRGE